MHALSAEERAEILRIANESDLHRDSYWLRVINGEGETVACHAQRIFVVDDLASLPDWYRMNTIFKLSYQAWVLLSLGGAVGVVQALRNARVWGKRQKAMEVATNQIDPRRIATLLKQCATLDAQSKGQAPGDAWLTLGGLAALAHGALAL